MLSRFHKYVHFKREKNVQPYLIVFPLLIIKATFWLPWRRHFVTVGEYVAVLRTCPEDPLVNLCIGLTLIHLAGQKYSSKKHSLFAQVRCRFDLYLSVLISCRKWMFETKRSCFKSCDFDLHVLHALQGLTFIYWFHVENGCLKQIDHVLSLVICIYMYYMFFRD